MIENPTDEQLRKLKGIIYLITNKINGKQYVGKAEQKFINRYSRCEWWKKTNKYLTESVKKYGKENFNLSILEHGIKDKKELKQLEIKYIKDLNVLYPNGYNFVEGDNHTDQSRILMAEKAARNYIFYDHKSEKLVYIHNLKKFCDNNNLTYQNMAMVARGSEKRYKHFTLPDVKLESWRVKSPDGIEYRILDGEFRLFCRKKKLFSSGLRAVCKGESFQCLGWTCPDFIFDEKFFVLKSPENKIFEVEKRNLNDFCKQFNLNRKSIVRLNTPGNKSHRGWKLACLPIDYQI